VATDLIARKLARLPLFQGLAMPQLNEIASNAETVEFHPGAVIAEQGADADASILIVTGEAVRVSGPELKARLEPIAPGSLLCESAMLVETVYGSTVVARTRVNGVRILRERMHAQIAKDPSIGDWLMQILASRLRKLANELREVDKVLAGEGTHLPSPPLPRLEFRLPAAPQ
jgi:CRP-like cAMP-binding protein